MAITKDSEDASSSKVTSPMPDSPLPSRPDVTGQEKENHQSTIDEATRKMADEIKSGRSPYDFRGELQEKKSFFANFPVAGVFFILLILFLATAGFFGYNKYTDMSEQFDEMTSEITTLSEQLMALRDSNDWTSKSTVRAELQKTLVALGRVISLGNVEATKKALKLRDEINLILIELEKEIIEDDTHSALRSPSGDSALDHPRTKVVTGQDVDNETESSDSILEKDPIKAIFGKPDKEKL